MTPNAPPPPSSSSSQARRPVSLFAFGFTPTAASASSPSVRPGATRAPSEPSTVSNTTRSASAAPTSSTRSSSAKPARGSRPGRVAQPGAGLAALRRMATAPAALPAHEPRVPSAPPSSRPSETRSPRVPPPLETQDSEQTPKRANNLDRSSPTPRRVAASSPSGRLAASHVSTHPSSSTLTSETADESDPETSQSRLVEHESSPARSARASSLSSDEEEIVVASRLTSARKTAPASSTRKRAATPRQPSPSPSAPRSLRSTSKPPLLAQPPSATPTRSSARLRSQSVEPLQSVPRLAFVAPTSSVAQQTTAEESGSESFASDTAVSAPAHGSTLPETSTTPRPLRSATRSPSLAPTSPRPSHDTAAPVTPGRDERTRFERDPSGSPLSDLAPSPVKPSTTATAAAAAGRKGDGGVQTKAAKRETWKPHAFELVVEVPASRWRTMRAGSIRRERDIPTSEYTDRRASVEADDSSGRIKREDGDGDEEMTTGDEGQGDGSTRTSPTTRRTSKPRARRTKRKHDAPSSSSSSSSEEDEEEEEEEDVMAALARARLRVAAGQTLAATTSPDVSGASTAPTTASSAHAVRHDKDCDDHVRRSSRARHQTDRFSSTVTGSSKGAAALGDVKGKGKAKTDGDRSFARMMKDLKAQQKKGRGQDWFEAQKRLIAASDDDLDEKSGASGDEEDLPDLNLDDSKRLTTLAQGIAGAVSEDDLLSPDKLAHKRRAKEVASFLGDEATKKAKAGKAGETREERQARTIWRDVHHYSAFEANAVTGKGWLGRVATAIRDGLKDPQRFPSSILLMSRLSPDGLGSDEDRKTAAKWLFCLACHPDTPPPLIEKLFNLFQRIAQCACRLHASLTVPLLSGEEVVQQLVDLGADPCKLLGKAIDAEAPTGDEEEEDLMELEPLTERPNPPSRRPTKFLTTDRRVAAVERWCRLVQIASSPATSVIGYIPSVVEACVKLSLDPTSAVLRGPLERTLGSLLESPLGKDGAVFNMFRRLAALYRSSRPHTQVEVLRALPHRSSTQKKLRKWLAYAYMAADEAFEQVVTDQGSLSRSHLALLLDLVKAPPPSSAFNPPANSTDSSNDVKLFQQATLLLISLTDLDDQLHVASDKEDSRDLVDQIVTGVKKMDSKLRADARKGLLVERIQAKNLLTSITTSLDYQLRRSRGQLAGYDITDVDMGQDDEVDGHLAKKVRVEVGA
ncbi:hypothetical protein JCM11491_003666 [Sporobolomyces phaffii]